MKMKSLICSFSVVLMLLLATPAMAGELNLTTLPAQTYGGYYVGATAGILNGVTPLSVVCDDFDHTTYVSSSFGINISTLPSLTFARFGNNAAALDKYERASWLMSQMPLNPSQVGPIQFAMWNLFYPGAPDPAGSDTWLANANAINVNAFDYRNVRVYTPTAQYASNQEFMGGSISQVPEPGTLELFGGGLIVLGLWGKRRLRKTATTS